MNTQQMFRVGAGLSLTVALTVGGSSGISQTNAQTISQTFTLPSISLGEFQNQGLPDSISTDRGIKVGGTFSDLFHNPQDAGDIFWATADRGPNGQLKVEDKNRRTFPVPEYNPAILQLRASNGKLEILKQIPVLTASGQPVTGLSNLDKIDEKPWNFNATEELPYNPNGIDPEGLVVAADGTFWLAEEYSPSILQISAAGKVLGRWVPQGRGLTGTDYPVQEVLPAVFNSRKRNRGLESLAISADSKTLYTLIQSPLQLPDEETGEASQMVRLLQLDAATAKTTGQFLYVMEPVKEFTDGKEEEQDEMKISGLAYVNPTTLLVLERTDKRAKIYQIDLSGSTNLLQGKFDDPAASPSLESLQPSDLDAQSITAVSKTLLVDLGKLPDMPDKIEGLTIVDAQSLAVGNDNDFDVDTKRGVGGFDDAGNLIPGDPPTAPQLLLIDLPAALKLE